MTRASVEAFLASHRLLRGLDRRLRGALGGARALHSGVWLGALSEDALVAVDEAVYRRAYAYHSTDAHNQRGLFPWEDAAVERHFPRSGRLLVTSAGGGREVIALRRRGFAVDAFECNAQLCADANARLARLGLAPDVRAAPRNGWIDTGQTYDGIVVGWGAYTYVRGRARRVALLAGLRAMAAPTAPVLLSFYARRPDQRAFRIAAAAGNPVARALGREPLEEGDVIDPTFQHYFTRPEVEAELGSAGFSPVAWSTDGFAHLVAVAGGGGG